MNRSHGDIPISGTGTILTSTSKFGPSFLTTPARPSFGILNSGYSLASPILCSSVCGGEILKSVNLEMASSVLQKSMRLIVCMDLDGKKIYTVPPPPLYKIKAIKSHLRFPSSSGINLPVCMLHIRRADRDIQCSVPQPKLRIDRLLPVIIFSACPQQVP